MGGSSLAPEVIAATFGEELILLDSTHPDDVRTALEPDPSETLFVISSKSGETIETLSHLKAIIERLERVDLKPPDHLIVISDPGSPLSIWAQEMKIRHFIGDATVGGRFSALSIFGLLPATLLGVDCATLLDDAVDMKNMLSQSDGENRAIELTREILQSGPFLHLPDSPLSYWIEQLIAESTGKEGRGVIPVISPEARALPSVRKAETLPLGAAFFLWEWCTALLGCALGVNPFDQPNVASAKAATQVALKDDATLSNDVSRTGGEVMEWIEKSAPGHGYLALLCYLPMRNPQIRDLAENLRHNIARKLGRAGAEVTLGFGPRYLHSTGQCHKGGPPTGCFVIMTLEDEVDYLIPDASYSFGKLIHAQALGDFYTLKHIGRPVIHAHLTRDELALLVDLSA
jgi:glucose-6-phosphate isomerase